MQEVISIGDKLDMEILIQGEIQGNQDKRRIFTCRVMDMFSDEVMRITMPFHEGRIVPLAIGDQYRICAYTHKGIYEGDFTVIKRLKDGNLFLADMEMNSPLKKVQRREYFRHDCKLPIEYRLVSSNEVVEMYEAEDTSIEWKKGVVLDISGGGLRMVSTYVEKPGQLMQIKLNLPLKSENTEIRLFFRLIICQPNPNKAGLYILRGEFDQIDFKGREQIIQYIFDEERKRISKEKGLS